MSTAKALLCKEAVQSLTEQPCTWNFFAFLCLFIKPIPLFASRNR